VIEERVKAENVPAAGVPVPIADGAAQLITVLLSKPLVSWGTSLPVFPRVA
jgi:hypothetical protein